MQDGSRRNTASILSATFLYSSLQKLLMTIPEFIDNTVGPTSPTPSLTITGIPIPNTSPSLVEELASFEYTGRIRDMFMSEAFVKAGTSCREASTMTISSRDILYVSSLDNINAGDECVMNRNFAPAYFSLITENRCSISSSIYQAPTEPR